jgi:dTDP-glucose 4,6-dehydratase
MNLLVTGGAGFVGSHFVRSALAGRLPGLAGASVTVLDKLRYAGTFANLGPVAYDRRLDFVPADVGDADVVDATMRGHDAVVHFAAATDDFVTTNVLGTQVLLDAAVRHGVARYTQVSTAEVYGPLDTGTEAWAEDSPVVPGSPYAASRAGADLIALACHRTHGLPVVVTRGTRTYGPYQHPGRMLPRVVTGLLDGRTVVLPHGGDQVRDWVHVDDHCRAVALALVNGRAGETYHIGGSVELADRDLAGELLTACGVKQDRIDFAPGTGEPPHRYAVDDDKIRRELGWRPRVEFTTGLHTTVRWYRDNPTWWRALLTE